VYWPHVPLTVAARTRITAVLCRLLLIGEIAFVCVWLATLVAAFAIRDAPERILGNPWFPGVVLVLGLAMAPSPVLWFWRRCDRCSRRLFSEPGNANPGKLDYRAKRLLGSYRRNVVWETARTGRARCVGCGHLDGDKLEYVTKTIE